MLIFIVMLIKRLAISYPIKKVIKYIFRKFGFRDKQLFLATFITSTLISIIVLLILYGPTMMTMSGAIGYTICYSYWLFLDFLCLNLNSKFIKFINNKVFRFLFGLIVFCVVFMFALVSYHDQYYVSQPIITILYMVFVYRKRSGGRISPGEYRIRPGR